MGDIANGRPCESAREYVLLSPVLYQPVTVRSAEPGVLWINVGTDSGFVGIALIPV